ncbi:tetratricopeptide repeat protein [Limnoglobus roseus]|uniref:Tetratricopeptide repeat protein n=1 Tax=Limnoglobus roseus TaxID=2598579 RepID=A0A5C1AL31_9BACT|nr:tetratricopeptide repeat protein [Limnoglobus roseus]QEL20099.1 tetratricopeptide repeat protein [Limnoglobus roseus]
MRRFPHRLWAFGLSATLLGGFTAPTLFAAPAAELTEEQLVEKAKKLNNETKTLEDADAKLKELVKDKPGTAKLVKAAAKLQKAAKEDNKPFRYFATLVLAKAAHNVKDYDSAEVFYKACSDIAIDDLQSSEHIIRAVEGHLDFLMARKKYDQIEELCERVMAINGDDSLKQFSLIEVMSQLLMAQSRKGQTDKAVATADKLIKQFDGNFIFRQLKARVLTDAEKYEDAIKEYEAAVDAVQDNENLKKDQKERIVRGTKYAISGIYVLQNKIDEGTKILRELVKEDPENATFKNDLGFIMCDNDKNLEESEKLIRDAIALDLKAREKAAEEGKIGKDEAKKANSAYIDSLGWVLFKNKKYEEALKNLLESAGSDDEESNHIEIWDHVGDCYAAMGKKKEALETYQKGLKMEDVTKKDGERRKKVTEKVKKLKAELSK